MKNKSVILIIYATMSVLFMMFCSCSPSLNINIIYPMENTWWEKNTSYPIKFSTNANTVDIRLYKGDNFITDIKKSYEVNPDNGITSITYTPSDTLEDGGDYKLIISDASSENPKRSETNNIHIVSNLDPTHIQFSWNYQDDDTESYGLYIIKSGVSNLLDNGNGTYTVNNWGEPGENESYTVQPTETDGIQYEDVVVIDNDGEGVEPAFYDLFFLGDDDFSDENIYVFTVYEEHLNIDFTQPGTYEFTYDGTENLNLNSPEPPNKKNIQ